jgi:sugar lactone lactonase YvrE
MSTADAVRTLALRLAAVEERETWDRRSTSQTSANASSRTCWTPHTGWPSPGRGANTTKESNVTMIEPPRFKLKLRLARHRPLAVVACLLAVTSSALAASLRTLIAFDPAAKQTPENVAIANDGTVYVSLSFASQIRRISANGQQTSLAIPTSGGITTGLAIDRRHGALYVGVRSADPAAAGIWRIPTARFSHPMRIAPLPAKSFANGITFDSAGNLYIADSDLGRIWRLAQGSSRATLWAQSHLLAPTGASYKNFPLPGANGIKLRAHVLYVTNTATSSVLAIPIRHDGRAGKITVRFHGIQGDDFAFAANGDMYITENPLSKLLRVTPTGRVFTVATAGDGLQNPSAVAFDPRPGHRTHLFITNSAYFGTQPSLQELTTKTVGLRMP